MGSRLTFDMLLPRGGRSEARSDSKRAESEGTRVLVIADLSGAGSGLGSARLVRIDVDNFETVLRALKPHVTLPATGGDTSERTLTFESMQDFHPDQLYDTLDRIVALRQTRDRLANSATFAQEHARLLARTALPASQTETQASQTETQASQTETQASQTETQPPEDDASTLERLLGSRPVRRTSRPPPAAAPQNLLDQMLRDLVAPHIVRSPGAQQSQAVAAADAAISDEMRRVLHAPAFQRLEATWRGLRWLVCESPGGANLQFSLLDASREAIVDDLRACEGELERSHLYRLIVREASGPGATPFSLVVGDLSFTGSEEDVSLLAGLGAAAAQAGGCFLAAAEPTMWGCHDLVSEPARSGWSKLELDLAARLALLRASTVAPFIGLCAPRVLGRVPYGKRSDPIDRFDFTELPVDPAHGDFLWLNPAFACAQLVLGAWADESEPGTLVDLGELPHAVYRTGSGDATQACAEVFLDQASAEHVLGHGVMPFMSHRNANAVRLLRLQSIASPPAPLALRH
jgi:type VI secretion system protein ImpC